MLNKDVFYLLSAVFGFLALASLISFILIHKYPSKNYDELIARIKSWWLMISVATFCIFLGKTALIVFFALISFLAMREFLALVSTTLKIPKSLILWLYLSIAIQFFWVTIEWYNMFLVFIPVFMLLFLPLWLVILGNSEGFLKVIGILQWGLMMTVFSLSHIAYLLVLPESVNKATNISIMLFLLVLTQFSDVCQYLWGKLLGKQKIVPKVSPNKTTAGLVGAIITIIILAIFLGPWLTPLNTLESMGAGLLLSLGGFFGDVIFSALKRDIGVKDTGELLPGHGGVLDRVDSLIFTAPLFFHVLYILHY